MNQTEPIVLKKDEKCKTKFEVIGLVASGLIVVSWIPQLVQLYSTQDVSGLNEWLFLITGVGNGLLAVYGGLNGSLAVVLTGTLVALSSFLVFIGILIFRIHTSSSS